MKTKSYVGVCLFICLALLAVSCSRDGKVKKFVEEFATAVSKGDRKAITQMYPDVTDADSLAVNFDEDSVEITRDGEKNLTTVKLREGVDLVLKESEDGQFVIQLSHGLFAYPADVLAFAKKTGQWKDGLNDVEQAVRMADQGLVDYLYKQFNIQLKNGLSIVNSGTYGDDYYEGEWVSAKGATFTVKNSTTVNIPGSAYQIIYKEGYWGGGSMSTEIVPGKDISAGGTVLLKTKKLGSSMESDVSERLEVKGISKEDFLKDFQPKGNEFDDYLNREGKGVKPKGESLTFVVEGTMGGCSTRLLLDGKSGSMFYYTNEEKVDRNVELVSYDPETGQLVLRVKTWEGKVTGNLRGTYRNGVYTGQFNNVNGKTSSFSFK